MADGQTGCGKTHTMQGASKPPELRGVIPRSFDHIFEHISVADDKGAATWTVMIFTDSFIGYMLAQSF